MRRSKTQKMVSVALLAAIGYVLMLLAFPVVPTFAFMKVDLSEIPILIGTYLYGPVAGVTVAFLRSTLHFITNGGDLGSLIGNVASFLAAIAYVLPIYYMSKRNKSKKRMIPALVVGGVSMTVVMAVANYFVITPLYLYVLHFSIGMPVGKYVLAGVVPFNIAKSIIVGVVFLLIHGQLLPWMMKKQGISDTSTKPLSSHNK